MLSNSGGETVRPLIATRSSIRKSPRLRPRLFVQVEEGAFERGAVPGVEAFGFDEGSGERGPGLRLVVGEGLAQQAAFVDLDAAGLKKKDIMSRASGSSFTRSRPGAGCAQVLGVEGARDAVREGRRRSSGFSSHSMNSLRQLSTASSACKRRSSSQLVDVEDGGALDQAVEGEVLDQLLARDDLGVVVEGPAQEAEEVEDGIGQVAERLCIRGRDWAP